MIDKSQETTNVPDLEENIGIPAVPPPKSVDDDTEALAKEELARLTPSNAKLRELAAKYPPPPEYFDGDEEIPFDPAEE